MRKWGKGAWRGREEVRKERGGQVWCERRVEGRRIEECRRIGGCWGWTGEEERGGTGRDE